MYLQEYLGAFIQVFEVDHVCFEVLSWLSYKELLHETLVLAEAQSHFSKWFQQFDSLGTLKLIESSLIRTSRNDQDPMGSFAVVADLVM